ncbi:MAG: DUF2505 domain-containing protein [Nannocystaceae bacterium]
MPKFTLNHEIHCTPERFWKVFFDRDFNTWLYREKLGFNEFNVISQSEGPAVTRVVRGSPKVDLPGPIRKLLGDRFGYEETGRFDPSTQRWTWSMKPSAMADKMKMEGIVRCEAAGAGKCRRIADITLEAKIFGVGGMIEKTSEKELRHGWDQSAIYMNQWIAERPE